MSDSPGSNIIPVLSVVAGAACAILIGSGLSNSGDGPEESVKSAFAKLSVAEQKLILGKAESLHRKWKSSPQDKDRLEEIHAAVTAQPELNGKLQRFHHWWVKLDSGQKRQLKQDGTFAENWADRASELYLGTQLQRHEISLKFGDSRITFTEKDFDSFLNAVIPNPQPADLTKRLALFSEEGQQCERVLVRSLWLYDDMRQRVNSLRKNDGEQATPVVDSVKIFQAVSDFLVTSEWQQKFIKDRGAAPRNPLEPVDGIPYWLPFFCLRKAIDHYDDQFKEKHFGGQRDDLLSVFVALSNDEPDLKKLDPDDVQGELRRRVIEEKSVQAKHTAVAQLAEQLNQFSRRPTYRWGPGRGMGRGRGDRPPGGGERRPPDGPPDRNGSGRNGHGRPDDNRTRPDSNEPGPPEPDRPRPTTVDPN